MFRLRRACFIFANLYVFIVIVFIVFILFSFGIFLFRNCTVPLRGCVNHNRETKIVFCWFYYFCVRVK